MSCIPKSDDYNLESSICAEMQPRSSSILNFQSSQDQSLATFRSVPLPTKHAPTPKHTQRTSPPTNPHHYHHHPHPISIRKKISLSPLSIPRKTPPSHPSNPPWGPRVPASPPRLPHPGAVPVRVPVPDPFSVPRHQRRTHPAIGHRKQYKSQYPFAAWFTQGFDARGAIRGKGEVR